VLGALPAALIGLLLAGVAWAAVGELTQKVGTAGCITETGNAGACVDGKGMTDPHAVIVSPDGKNAYSASLSDGSIGIFDRNPVTGALTQKAGTAGCISEGGSGGLCADGKGLDGAISIDISADGKNLYAVSFFGDAITIFDRNPTTGELVQKSGTDGCISDTGSSGECVDGHTLETAQGVTVSPDGKNVYAAVQFSGQGAVVTFDRDTSTGVLTQSSGTAGCIASDGDLGLCVTGRGIAAARSITVSGDGKNVYVASASSSLGGVAIFDRNTSTGALTQKAGTAGCVSETGAGPCTDGTALANPVAIDLSPDGESAYVSNQGSDSVAIFDRNTTTGVLTQKAGTAGCISETGTAGACVDGIALDNGSDVTVAPDGATVYTTSLGSASIATEGIAIFDRNTTTGALTQKAGALGCIDDDSSGCAVAPEMRTPQEVTVSPDELNAYVADQQTPGVLIFDRTAPPQTTIDSGPTVTNDSTPTFGFSSSEAGSTFQCRVDSASFSTCSGPGHTHTTFALGEGPHTFQVRATDPTSDTDLSPASRTFTIDFAAPDTFIDSGPSGPTADDTPAFAFSASEAGSTFECRFDSAPFKPCAGPGSTHSGALKDGSHTFEVRATDPGSNLDPTPALRAFSVDSTPPITLLGKVPKPIVKTKGAKKKVKVSFSSEGGAIFECKLDTGSFKSCGSPFAAKAKSKPGKGKAHTVTIRAIDALGNAETDVAVVTFRLVRAG
jgi:DNA-binding beta-propeller fold protein YncE